MRTSCGTPRLSRVRAACSIVSQSDFEPMMMPTRGRAFAPFGRGLCDFTFFFGISSSSETLCLTKSGHGPSTALRVNMPCPYESKEGPTRGGRYLEFGTVALRAVEILSGKAGIFDRVPIGIGTLRMTT